jgi:hypothetical protein
MESVLAAVDIMTHPLGLHMSRYKVCACVVPGMRVWCPMSRLFDLTRAAAVSCSCRCLAR